MARWHIAIGQRSTSVDGFLFIGEWQHAIVVRTLVVVLGTAGLRAVSADHVSIEQQRRQRQRSVRRARHRRALQLPPRPDWRRVDRCEQRVRALRVVGGSLQARHSDQRRAALHVQCGIRGRRCVARRHDIVAAARLWRRLVA